MNGTSKDNKNPEEFRRLADIRQHPEQILTFSNVILIEYNLIYVLWERNNYVFKTNVLVYIISNSNDLQKMIKRKRLIYNLLNKEYRIEQLNYIFADVVLSGKFLKRIFTIYDLF